MRKVVINTLICLVCTAIIFYLHFAVYDGMLLQDPFFTGSICAICIVFAPVSYTHLTLPTKA